MSEYENELLGGLESLGCRIDRTDGGIFIALDDYAEFVFEHMTGFENTRGRIYLGSMLLTPEEIAGSEYAAALNRFLLELQDRSLGCHFSYNQEDFLTIGHEFDAERVAARDLFGVMEQISFIIEVCLPLFDRILDSGVVPDDQEMHQAFGLQAKFH